MKMFIASLLVLSSVSLAHAGSLVFSCSPLEDRKGVEGVEINQVDSSMVMSIFTKSNVPGRLNEEQNMVVFSNDGYFHSYVSAEHQSSMKIHVFGGKPRKEGWYVGQLLNKKFDVLFSCQYKL